MENVLDDLDYKFDIKTNKFSPHHIEGYQKYYGTTGSSSKGGCGVYVNESLNFTQCRDLDK